MLFHKNDFVNHFFLYLHYLIFYFEHNNIYYSLQRNSIIQGEFKTRQTKHS